MVSCFITCFLLVSLKLFRKRLIYVCGDIEPNPALRPNSSQSFSICRWNVKSTVALNISAKVSLLKAYNVMHTCGIIRPSEAYFNHHKLIGNYNLEIPGYELIKVGQLANQKRGGIFIYQKVFLPAKVNNVSYFSEPLNFGLNINGKHGNITLIYCSQSQLSDEIRTFNKSF